MGSIEGEVEDIQTRHQILSRWSGATVVVNYLRRTGDVEECEANPFFPIARAIVLDVILGERMIPKERREVQA